MNNMTTPTGSGVRISARRIQQQQHQDRGPIAPSALPRLHQPAPKLPLPPKTAVAGFVSKLFQMVNDAPNGLIHWSPAGTAFIVTNPEEFSKIVLPHFFKHNNFSSFVRQLNMYGFHKVPQPQQGSLASATADATAGPEASPLILWEFAHENFIRGKPELLHLVRRKPSKEEIEESLAAAGIISPATAPMSLSSLQQSILTMIQQQEAIKADLDAVQRESRMLWNESVASRERYQHQQQLIDKILQFLATVFINTPNALGGGARDLLNSSSASAVPQNVSAPSNKRQKLLTLEDNLDFQQTVYDLFQSCSTNNRQPSSTPPKSSAIVTVGPSHLRDRVVDLSETSKAVGEDISSLQDQLTFIGQPRSKTTSPALQAPNPRAIKKRPNLELDVEDELINDLLHPPTSKSVPPVQAGPSPSAILAQSQVAPSPPPPLVTDEILRDDLILSTLTTNSYPNDTASPDDFDISRYLDSNNFQSEN